MSIKYLVQSKAIHLTKSNWCPMAMPCKTRKTAEILIKWFRGGKNLKYRIIEVEA